MINTKHHEYFEEALNVLVGGPGAGLGMYASPYILRDKADIPMERAESIIESFRAMEIVDEEGDIICVDLSTRMGEVFKKEGNYIVPDVEKLEDTEVILFYKKWKYSTEFVKKEIFPLFKNVIEWWNTNTNKYNQMLTEKYYPNKKWSSLSEKKVFALYLAENKNNQIIL